MDQRREVLLLLDATATTAGTVARSPSDGSAGDANDTSAAATTAAAFAQLISNRNDQLLLGTGRERKSFRPLQSGLVATHTPWMSFSNAAASDAATSSRRAPGRNAPKMAALATSRCIRADAMEPRADAMESN